MKMPAIIRKENRAPVAWAAILTFIAWNAFGFGWFGLPNLASSRLAARSSLPRQRWKRSRFRLPRNSAQ